MSTDVLLQATDLTLEYHDGARRIRAVEGVSLDVRRGEFVGLVGPSGSGKSSLLFLLAGLRAPTAGRVALLGQPLPPQPDANAALRRRHVGFLFHEPFLVPYLDVRENALSHATDPEAPDRLERLAAAIGMDAPSWYCWNVPMSPITLMLVRESSACSTSAGNEMFTIQSCGRSSPNSAVTRLTTALRTRSPSSA